MPPESEYRSAGKRVKNIPTDSSRRRKRKYCAFFCARQNQAGRKKIRFSEIYDTLLPFESAAVVASLLDDAHTAAAAVAVVGRKDTGTGDSSASVNQTLVSICP